MAALAGKAAYGTVTGSVKINGRSDKLLRYKRVMGFVPQVSFSAHHSTFFSVGHFVSPPLYIWHLDHTASTLDNLAEWSKALDLGSSPKGREFKSHSCHQPFAFGGVAHFEQCDI